MWWLLFVVVLAVVLVGLAGWVVVRRNRRENLAPGDADPLFVVGVAITGAGAATVVTLGPIMLIVMVIGLGLMGSGWFRGHHRGAS